MSSVVEQPFQKILFFRMLTLWYGALIWEVGAVDEARKFGTGTGKYVSQVRRTLSESTAKVSLAGNVHVRFFRRTRFQCSFRQCWAQRSKVPCERAEAGWLIWIERGWRANRVQQQ